MSGRGHKLTKEECQKKVSAVSPNVEVLRYISAIVPVQCKCSLCGNEWSEPSKNLYRGSNCPNCFKRKKNDWDTVSFLRHIANINPNISLSGKYTSGKSIWHCVCKKCGFSWKSTSSNLLSGHGCQKCAVANSNVRQTKSHSQFVSEMSLIQPNITILSQYKRAKSPIKCKCNKCAYIWSPTPSNLLSGFGCPECGRTNIKKKQLKSHEKFVQDLFLINPNLEIVSRYQGSKELIRLRCKVCDEEWFIEASSAISHPSSCPACNASRGEKAIASYLKNMGFKYIPQYRFKGLVGVGGALLSYDFYLPTIRTLIEYQGQFHDGTVKFQREEQFANQIEHDIRKREYAKQNGFHLIEIWYYDFKRINEILDASLYFNSMIITA